MTKPDILLSLWICHHVLFNMVWHMTAYGSLIVNNGRFFLFSLSCQVKCTIVLLFWFFNFSPHSFNFLLCFYFFYRSFFQFSPSITISHMFCFSFWSLFFLIVFLDSFIKGFFDFQFHHSIKVLVVLVFSL